MKTFSELIKEKKINKSHSKEEIDYIVNSYTLGETQDDMMAKWLKAICENSMNFDETVNYTNSIINSGKRVLFDDCDGYVIDKHSTGGVGDKISLILGPILAACGCYVPMIVGRYLGHTGGTLDKLESIDGYNGHLELDRFQHIVKDVGISIIGQTKDICPADKKIYNLRDKTSTIKSFPLICGSIMGKKISEGIEGLVLDVKTGNGAFMDDVNEAKALGQHLSDIGLKFGLDVKYAVTDMSQPLGDYSGQLCEVIESMETLKGNGPNDILDVIYYLGEISLSMAGIDNSKDKINHVIDNGSAYEVLCKMISAHGGDLSKIKYEPKYIKEIKVAKSGYLNFNQTKEMGNSILALSGHQNVINNIHDSQSGFRLFKKHGSFVEENDVIGEMFCMNQSYLNDAIEIFKDSFDVVNQKPNLYKLIYN
ncbi:MAG: thymidine phosphorylase [Candidatus Marinimicrobia bacterium]|nr:thymidine phosphorylase [Candidatus Neomarinimicrobiota bacterium]|tara:strand:- start:1896 stop:3167 length:1272 start_codon:yes stop_codon:yes gene_type:complete